MPKIRARKSCYARRNVGRAFSSQPRENCNVFDRRRDSAVSRFRTTAPAERLEASNRVHLKAKREWYTRVRPQRLPRKRVIKVMKEVPRRYMFSRSQTHAILINVPPRISDATHGNDPRFGSGTSCCSNVLFDTDGGKGRGSCSVKRCSSIL